VSNELFKTWLYFKDLSKDKRFLVQFVGALVLCLCLFGIVVGRAVLEGLSKKENKTNSTNFFGQVLQGWEKSIPFSDKKEPSLSKLFEDIKESYNSQGGELFEEGGVFFVSQSEEVVLSEINFVTPNEGEVFFLGDTMQIDMRNSSEQEFSLELRVSNFDCYQDATCQLFLSSKAPSFVLDDFSGITQRMWNVGMYKDKKNFLFSQIPEDRYVLMAVDRQGKILGKSKDFVILKDKTFRTVEFYNPTSYYNQLSLSNDGKLVFMWSVIHKITFVSLFLENDKGVQTKIADNIRNTGFFVWKPTSVDVSNLKKGLYKLVLKDSKGLVGKSVPFGLK
jgi:hypothetical protein